MHHTLQHQLGAHEVMEAHEVLTDIIDGINQFELYRPHINDPELARIHDKQVRFMHQEYQNLSGYLNQHRGVSTETYRSRINKQPVYGLRNPSPVNPHHEAGKLDDRDVASGMLGCNKASAVLQMNACLECADPTLRHMILNSSVSCAEKAYEIFSFMNQRGMYQVPTMLDKTQHTLLGTYHAPMATPEAPQARQPQQQAYGAYVPPS